MSIKPKWGPNCADDASVRGARAHARRFRAGTSSAQLGPHFGFAVKLERTKNFQTRKRHVARIAFFRAFLPIRSISRAGVGLVVR